MNTYEALKASGQILSGDLAKRLKRSERSVSVDLHPYIVKGDVMSCRVFDGSGKYVGTEYRISGQIPIARPGRKPAYKI